MTKHIRTYSRKGSCPVCKVSTGSKHNKLCIYAYNTEENSKSIYNKQKDYKIMLENQSILAKQIICK